MENKEYLGKSMGEQGYIRLAGRNIYCVCL
jgi:hypothetical protein